jgi:predicted permease
MANYLLKWIDASVIVVSFIFIFIFSILFYFTHYFLLRQSLSEQEHFYEQRKE